MTGQWVIIGTLAALALGNARMTFRLWKSPVFERGQKIAQTVLVWLIPGMFLIVRLVLGPVRPSRPGAADDPTIGDAYNTYVDPTGLDVVGHHGGHGFGGGGHGV